MRLKIDKPCNEDWNSMSIGVISRHCIACEKAVFDFTNKSKEEILTFLIQNQNKSICGRLKKSQVDFHHDELEVIIEGLKTQKNNKYAFAILSLACLAMVSCSDEPAMGVHADTISAQTIDSVEQTSIKDDSTSKCEIEKRKIKESLELDSNTTELFGEEGLDEIMGIIMPLNDNDTNSIYTLPEIMPKFPGGIDSLFSFLGANLIYPEWEKKNNIKGKVYVNFVVEKDGSVSDIKVIRSVKGSKNFDSEVVRVMKLMPKWTPGKQKGREVAVYYNLPINFNLKD